MVDSIKVKGSTSASAVNVATSQYDGVHYPIYANNVVSTGNQSTTLLTNGSSYTGDWEDVSAFNDVVVSVKTDQNGTYQIQFSPDGVNVDSTLTRYYRTNQINVPHRFTITRKYCRVVFTNDSGSDQTYLRLQVIYGHKTPLNVPCDAVVSQDYDATVVRPTSYTNEVALGLRQGTELWNKFGYNSDVDVGTELVANFGGPITLYTTASTLTISSDSASDTDGGTGCNSLVIYGHDINWNEQIEVVTLDGTNAVTTTGSFISYPNRVAMYLCGTGQTNAGNITVKRTSESPNPTVAYLAAGEGVTQQCIFTVCANHKFLAEWMLLNAARQAAQNPYVTFKLWVYSLVNNGIQEVFRFNMDTAVQVEKQLTPHSPFPIGEKSIMWLTATTDKDDTSVTARFSGELIRDVDA